ncbi:MAG TPA: type II toxin-antitoxin system HipA family toxin [Solirubrobacterales bacterium]|nr:type II toxin-antitoxin system HipA family toxin [Solirubrobacterales bacterium]
MSEALDVYLHGRRAGTLERRERARLRFAYAEAWVEAGEAPISLSLPVRERAYGHDECAPFFEGLLPEGDFLKAISRTLHVSARNPFQLLAEIGGECAGAVSVGPVGGPVPGLAGGRPQWLDDGDLGRLLGDLPERPLPATIDEEEGFRISLAGAQDKLGVLFDGGRVGLTRGDPPSTHIVKAPIPGVADAVANEAFCMALAAQAGLSAAAAESRLAAGSEYLLVRRYDREESSPDGRLHQEDLCQALGLVPAVKYESEGGPTIDDCARLIRRHSAAPARDVIAFLDALLFNFLIGNHDAHSKNYSLLLDGPEAIRLAPLYDLLCTAVIDGTSRSLAMKYGGEKRPRYLRRRHLERLAADLQVRPGLVERRAAALADRALTASEDARRSLPVAFQERPIIDRIGELLVERADRLRKDL